MKIRWTPAKVSLLSLLLMGVVVLGIGIPGLQFTIDYLYAQMERHAVGHNREVASHVESLLAPRVAVEETERLRLLQRVMAIYGAFGYRLFLLDEQGRLLADSHSPIVAPRPVASTWLRTLREGAAPGVARAEDEQGHPLLIWFESLRSERYPGQRFLLGVASDQQRFLQFMQEVHRNLDVLLVLTYLAIGGVGLFALRFIGRAYERRLEAEVDERSRALRQAHREMLEQTRLATIGQTAAVLAHEMRNPLSSIKLALSGMQDQSPLPERAKRRIDLVVGEVDRLDQLLTQTLDYARPLQFGDRPVAIDDVIDRVIEQQRPLLEQAELRLVRKHCPDCRLERVDENKLYQALLNGVRNALEASPRGGCIEVSLEMVSENELLLRICNEGETLERQVVERAFEPFFTTKPRGSGLGLGLVRRIVEEHGGTVCLEARPGGGACLKMALPREVPAKESRVDDPDGSPKSGSRPGSD